MSKKKLESPMEKSKKQEFVENCKSLKLETMKNKKVFIQYLDKKGLRRDRSKPAVGVLIAYKNDDGEIVYGWSKKAPGDIFNKHVAFYYAASRAGVYEDVFFDCNVPHVVFHASQEFSERVDRYYRRVEQEKLVLGYSYYN